MNRFLRRWRRPEPPIVQSDADEPPNNSPAINCRGLTKEFGHGETRVLALRGVNVMALPGSITMLVGPSGCGKTTLASIVAGLLNPTDGELQVLGQDIRQLSPAGLIAFRARNIGFVFQQYNLLPTLTAAQNAFLPLLVAGQPRGESLERARQMLERVGLGGKSEAYPSQLSGGQQQRVAIARALVHEPRLLICDEPTAALDAQSGQTVMELFCQVAVRPGRAVLVVTHDNRILHYAQRIVHMSDGRIKRVEIENTAEHTATVATAIDSPFSVELST
jgi:putative ABC transport system ATP-binding protein